MSNLETYEENKIKKWCKVKGILFIKYTPKGSRGWPDRIAIFPGGFHMWVELKKKGEVPYPIQNYRMNQLAAMGAAVDWFDNADDCIAVFNDCYEAALQVDFEELKKKPTNEAASLLLPGGRK
jgi:hypothetical protein